MATAAGGAAAPYLRVERVSKTFGSFAALKDVSLSIGEREFVCFLGPSGCGKTTLLRAIAGLDPQTAGRIVQGGRDISGLPPAARDFGIVFQSYALFPNLTAAQNIAYGLENRRARRADVQSRVRELAELVSLTPQLNKYPAQLSGGQQQRVALARAVALSPGLLLLDEPLSALDARVRQHLRGELKGLQRRLGVTTIMVTHDQEEALTIADRIVVMRDGVIEQTGTPREIYDRPATRFVADFVGTMNFLPGTMTAQGRVRVGGLELACAADAATAGSKVTVCLRPEDVVVRGIGDATPNSFEARIAAAEYMGSFVRARLAVPGLNGAGLTADFSLNAVRDLGLGDGATLRAALPAERLRIFPDGKAS